MFSRVINKNNEDMLRKITVKIGLKRIDIQEEVIVEMLLDSGVIVLYASPPVQKLHSHSDIIFQLYKPGYSIFHSRVTLISVSTLKPLLREIRTLPLKF